MTFSFDVGIGILRQYFKQCFQMFEKDVTHWS